MYELILIVHVVISCALIGLVLIQQGKGAEVGAAFGSGASQTIFGSQGSGSFLTRVTALLSTIFFATSLSLSYIAAHNLQQSSTIDLPDNKAIQLENLKQPKTDASNYNDAPAVELPKSK